MLKRYPPLADEKTKRAFLTEKMDRNLTGYKETIQTIKYLYFNWMIYKVKKFIERKYIYKLEHSLYLLFNKLYQIIIK